MGLGNFLCEEMLYDADGRNVTNSTWQYKVGDGRSQLRRVRDRVT
jgi:hypothetical protein